MAVLLALARYTAEGGEKAWITMGTGLILQSALTCLRYRGGFSIVQCLCRVLRKDLARILLNKRWYKVHALIQWLVNVLDHHRESISVTRARD